MVELNKTSSTYTSSCRLFYCKISIFFKKKNKQFLNQLLSVLTLLKRYVLGNYLYLDFVLSAFILMHSHYKHSYFSGKDISLMMQALESLQSPEEKIAALCKKYADLLQQQKLLQKQLKTSQKKQVCIRSRSGRCYDFLTGPNRG